MSYNFEENHKVIHCFDSTFIADNADFMAGNPASDVITMDDYRTCVWTIIVNAGGTGYGTITVESCNNTTPGTTTAVAFRYRKIQDPDTHGAWTDATSSGFATSAEADCIYEIKVHANGLSSTDKYVRLQMTETNSTAQDGAAYATLWDPRYADSDPDTSGSNVE